MFYDNWVARDINGTALENAPFEQVFHHTESNHRFQRHLPVQGELVGTILRDVELTCSAIVLERYRCPRSWTVLRLAPRQVQNGEIAGWRMLG